MTMLYTNGNSTTWENMTFDYIKVEDDKVDEFLKKGYVKHPLELEAKKTALKGRKVKNELDKETVN